MIKSIPDFINYFEGIRRRTLNYINTIPNDGLDWLPQPGEFTCRDILFHIAGAEKMFVEAFVTNRWHYHDRRRDYEPQHPQPTLPELIADLEKTHADAMESLRTVDDSELMQTRRTLDGPEIKAWRLLMMLVEHEVHHRSHLAMYLFLMGVKPPQIYGMTLDDAIARATG